jgi:hypothetical protein
LGGKWFFGREESKDPKIAEFTLKSGKGASSPISPNSESGKIDFLRL